MSLIDGGDDVRSCLGLQQAAQEAVIQQFGDAAYDSMKEDLEAYNVGPDPLAV